MSDPFIDLVYEASLVPELWPRALDEMARVSEAEGTLLFADVPSNPRWTSSATIRGFVIEWLNSEWLQRNERGNRLIPRREPRFLTDLDGFTPEELDRSPYYTQFLRPRGFGWCAGTVVRCPGGDTIVFSIEKAYSRGPVSQAAVTALDAMRPHLARAVLLSARIGLERARATVSALETIGLPAAVLRTDARILAANEPFLHLSPVVSTAARDIAVFSNAQAQRMFSEALAAMQAVPTGATGSSIAVPAAPDGIRLAAHLVPVRGAGRDIFNGATALLYFTPIAAGQAPDVKLLEMLFDLTPAEARVASSLTEGRSVDDIARQQQVAANTIRRHLKSIFSKTGVHRQAELVSLLGSTGGGRLRRTQLPPSN